MTLSDSHYNSSIRAWQWICHRSWILKTGPYNCVTKQIGRRGSQIGCLGIIFLRPVPLPVTRTQLWLREWWQVASSYNPCKHFWSFARASRATLGKAGNLSTHHIELQTKRQVALDVNIFLLKTELGKLDPMVWKRGSSAIKPAKLTPYLGSESKGYEGLLSTLCHVC